MFVTLYNKKFEAIGSRTTYLCNSWTLIRKAYEFDELTVKTKKIENSSSAVFVGLHEDKGALKYMGILGVPTTIAGITTIKAVDIRQILDQEVSIDLTAVHSVQELYEYLLGIPKTLNVLGAAYKVDANETKELNLNEDTIDRSKEIGNLWDTVQAVNMIYGCFVSVEVNFVEHVITLKVKRITNVLSLKLEDFGEAKVMNDKTTVNRVICTDGKTSYTFYLLNDDSILEARDIGAFQEQIVYPGKIKTIEKEDINEAVSEGLKELYNNRFKEKVEITCENQLQYIFDKIDLDTYGDIYGYNSADDSTCKRLPVASISEDSNGKKKVTFGRLSPYW